MANNILGSLRTGKAGNNYAITYLGGVSFKNKTYYNGKIYEVDGMTFPFDMLYFIPSTEVKKNDIIEIRGIKIDKTARRVWVNGEETTFTSKEYDLLTFLAENPNRVFTKEELFREIWDMESVGDIATVTVHIKKIREKIEYDTSNPQYIETIWGVGYRFKM